MRCRTHTDASKHSTSNLQNGQIVGKPKLCVLSWSVPAFSTWGRWGLSSPWERISASKAHSSLMCHIIWVMRWNLWTAGQDLILPSSWKFPWFTAGAEPLDGSFHPSWGSAALRQGWLWHPSAGRWGRRDDHMWGSSQIFSSAGFSPSSLLFQNAGLIAQRFSIHSFHVVTSPHSAGQIYWWEKHTLVKWSGRGSSCMPVQFPSLLLNLTCVCYG